MSKLRHKVAVALALGLVCGCGPSTGTGPPDELDQAVTGDRSTSRPVSADTGVGGLDLPSEEVDTIYRSGSSGLMDRARLVVRSEEAWTEVWSRITALMVSPEPRPDIDFTSRQLLVVAMGSRPSGGFGIDVTELRTAADTLYAVVRESSPGPGCMTTQALTQPVTVVAVPLLGESVVFAEEETVADCG